MKNRILFIVFLMITSFSFGQPANDNCTNATVLTVNGPLICNTTNNATSQAGEQCLSGAGGITNRTVWYSFVANNSTMVLDFLRTNTTSCFGYLSVYGPNTACIPGAGSFLPGFSCVNISIGDPGLYYTLTGLIVGSTYRIQINGIDCGGSGDRFHNFCIGIYNVAINNTVNSSSVVNQCGVVFNGSSVGGYTPSGTGSGFRNLDNNASTTCPSCGAIPGSDVSFVINNDSWFKFCSAAGGTWSLNFNVGSCVFSGLNSGLQMAIFTGTSSALTWHSQATNPTYSGGSWNSPTISLSTGACAFMVVDGFAGDACNYNYTLTNLTGGCILLPIELISFGIKKSNEEVVQLIWETASEKNNDYFTIERSIDGEIFYSIGKVAGAGNSTSKLTYRFNDLNPILGMSYYRLKQTDFDGAETTSMIVSNNINAFESYTFDIYPNPNTKNSKTIIDFKSKKEELILLEIFDNKGTKIFSNTILIDGSSLVELNYDLKQGVYFVRATNSSSEQISKKYIVN